MTTIRNPTFGSLATSTRTACVGLILALATAAVPAAEPVAPGCVLATVDGIAVTEGDARAIQALLSPPPSRAAARRLAVDAALAWWDTQGWLAGSSARGRLEAWRAWLVAGNDGSGSALDVRSTARGISGVAARARLAPGACAPPAMTVAAGPGHEAGDARGQRAAERLRHAAADEAPVSFRVLRVATLGDSQVPDGNHAADRAGLESLTAELRECGLEPELHTVTQPVSRLAPPLALAVAQLPTGTIAGPIETRGGTYWLEKR